MICVKEEVRRQLVRGAKDQATRAVWPASKEAMEKEIEATYPRVYRQLSLQFMDLLGDSGASIFAHLHGMSEPLPLSPLVLVLKQITDYSLCVPLESQSARTTELSPAHRFGAAVQAISEMRGKPLERFTHGLGRNPSLAYDMLDRAGSFHYRSWESPADWLQWLEDAYNATHSPITWVRRKAMEFRQNNYMGWIAQSPWSVLKYSGLMWLLCEGVPEIAEDQHRPPFTWREFHWHLSYYIIHVLLFRGLVRKHGLAAEEWQISEICRRRFPLAWPQEVSYTPGSNPLQTMHSQVMKFLDADV